MSLLLDHVFILTEPGALVAERIAQIGLAEGPANVHPGQGTANRRFFVPGFTLELLYISDYEEARNGAGRKLEILQRKLDTNASPFGLVVRVYEHGAEPEFPGWQYQPDYFPEPLCFHIGVNSSLYSEPLCICMPPSLPEPKAQPVATANPNWQLDSVEICLPAMEPSEVLEQFAAIDRLRVVYGKPHEMTLNFNNGKACQKLDLKPELALQINY